MVMNHDIHDLRFIDFRVWQWSFVDFKSSKNVIMMRYMEKIGRNNDVIAAGTLHLTVLTNNDLDHIGIDIGYSR